MARPFGAFLSCLVLITAHACSAPAGDQSFMALRTKPSLERREAFRRAAVWQESNIESIDVRRGPGGPGALPFLATVTCDYSEQALRGHSQKFACLAGHDLLRVKFGATNGEVYGEVAATRLLWTLGFGADRMYPVRVICRGCPSAFGGAVVSGGRMFDPAVIERPMAGAAFEDDDGWAWPDLDDIDERAGGAPHAQRDGLKLLAAFLQHTDNKREQQRLRCVDEPRRQHPQHCARPFLMLDDLGLTFGTANLANLNALGGANLDAWRRTPVWTNLPGCVANLSPSFTGTMSYPRISEEGRAFLANLLGRLSQRQIRELFEVSRVDQRDRSGQSLTSIEDWVRVFDEKRHAIADRRCN